MATIELTKELGEAIFRLQNGWAIAVSRGRRSSNQYHQWFDNTAQPLEGDAEEVFIKLKKLRLLDRVPATPMHLNHHWRVRKAWGASEKCREFKLPPRQFWK